MAAHPTAPARPAAFAALRLRALAAPLTLFLGALLLYLATLTQVHTFDALSYVTSVERKPWTEMFHPHHLAYGPLGALALALARALGYPGGAALPMQLVNAAAGAAGVALFFAIVRRATGRADLALAVALLLGGAYAYWYYAVEIEVYTVAAVFLLLSLWLLLGMLRRPSARTAALLGLAQGGAVLFHQTNVLFCAAVLVALLLGRPGAAYRAPRLWLAYAGALALTVGAPYLIVILGVSGFRSFGEIQAWLLEYARTGWWGGPITAKKWALLGQGLAETLAQPGGALLGLLLAGLLLLHLRRALAGPRALVAALVAWLLAYGAFFLWWEPDNIEFWIASLPPALLLLALALRAGRRWGAGVWIVLAVALTALATNYDSIARRGDARTDLQRTIARGLAAQSRPADVLLVPDGLLELYLPYYEQRENVLSLNQALFDSGDDWSAACAAVQGRIEQALHAGATVIVADAALHPPDLVLQRHRLAQPQIDACFAPYRPLLRPLPLPPEAPPYWRLPTADELATGDGWRFTAAPLGWQAAHVAGERFDGGWRFVPGTDPALLSPRLDLEAASVGAIEIRLANGTRARDAQLFFAGPDERMDEARSVRWTLAPGTGVTTYRIDLRDAPGWRGRITRLRLDPVGVGDGGAIWLESLRLLPPR
jgi:hypothetical protein